MTTYDEERRAAHRCHARGCKTPTKPELLMCAKHWRMVPKDLQRAVWDTYRDGQCDDMSPSREWHEAADAAIEAVYKKEVAPLIGRERLGKRFEVDGKGYYAIERFCGTCFHYHAGECAK